MTATTTTADGDGDENSEQRRIITLADADPEGFMPVYEAFKERFDATSGESLVGEANGDYALVDQRNVMGLFHTGEVDVLEKVTWKPTPDDFKPVKEGLSRVTRGRLGAEGTYEVVHSAGRAFYSADYVLRIAQFLETPPEDLSVSFYTAKEWNTGVLRIDIDGTEWAIVLAPYLPPAEKYR